jgi:AcrR family transcriptional regulator
MPAAREQLFDATDRLLRRDRPAGIATRAITDEAGVAKGILHNHFGDLDTFLGRTSVIGSAAWPSRRRLSLRSLVSTPWSTT